MLVGGRRLADSAAAILNTIDDIPRLVPNFAFDLVVTSRSGAKRRWCRSSAWWSRRYEEPGQVHRSGRDAREALLMVGQDLWIYLPTTSQPIRISAHSGIAGADLQCDVRVWCIVTLLRPTGGSRRLGDQPCTKVN